jgi:phytoene synthase
MRDAFAYCETFLREEDRDRYLTALFAPMSARAALCALYAFDIETERVAMRVREPLAGEIRLQWWQDTLTGERADEAAGHPVTAAFLETMQRFSLPPPQVSALLDARRARLYEEPLGGLDVLGDFARATAGNVFSLAARILNGGRDAGIGRLADAAALASVIDREAGAHRYAGNVLEAARMSLMQARERIADAPERVLPAFLPLALTNARLARMEKGASPALSPWRRQWIIWRASKNLAAWL